MRTMWIAAATLCMAAPLWAQASPADPKPVAMAAPTPGVSRGYLTGAAPIDILKLLPPPPAPGSAQEAADIAAYKASKKGIGSDAWKAASAQANPTSSAFLHQISCVIGVELSPKDTPATMTLFGRSTADFLPPMTVAKDFYKRKRPFTTDHGKACDPIADDGVGAKLGWSYPSGHSGIGWLWALVLGDAAPSRAEALRAFGQGVGDHRIDCRVHWLSDVAYGRLLTAAVYSRIAATPAYAADVAAARAELAKAAPLTCAP